MIIQRFHTPGIFANTYLLGDSETRQAVVVDPTRDVEPMLVFAKNEGFVITHIIRTRIPNFFISGVKELLHRLNNKPSVETKEFSLGSILLKPVTRGEHTTWLGFDLKRSKDVPAIAFTGEALLVASVGRPDILSNLYQVLFNDLSSLSDFVEIYPGVSAGSIAGKNIGAKASSTIGYERQFNPYFKKVPEEKWNQEIMTQSPAKPDTLQHIKDTNEKGPRLLSELGGLTQEGPTLYIDIRSPENYAKGHLTDSINIPLGPSFCNWALAVLDHNYFPITIVHDNHMHIPTALKYLCLIGFDKFTDYLFWNEEELGREYLILENPLISVDEVKQQLKDLTVLDVRTLEEWNQGHIEGAMHVELNKLRQSLDKIPRDKPIRAICGSGNRSSVAVSFLKASGFDDVRNIEGGMRAWNAKNLSK
jgi:hydroxyacylglutathione hydrolase